MCLFDTSPNRTSTRMQGRGGVNCEAKAQVLHVKPPPPSFLEVGHKGGGGGGGGGAAGQYGTLNSVKCSQGPSLCIFCARMATHKNVYTI